MPQRPPQHQAQRVECKTHNARPSASKRGYGRRWQRLARMFKRRNPLCADPFGIHADDGSLTFGEHVDHIVALSAGGTNDWSNLQSLCASCHSRKTVLCDGGFGNPRYTPRGGDKSLQFASE